MCIRIGRVVFPHSSLPTFSFPSVLSVPPWQVPSFHQFAASLSPPKTPTPLQSSKSRLFCQNTRGTLCDLCAPISVPSVLCFFLDVTCFHQPAASCSLLPLFFALAPFVFSTLQPLLRKTGGWGWVW